MTSTEKRYYDCLRRTWKETAVRALEMARDRVRAEQAGITFDWQPEQENPRDVFGDPDPINGPFYDPDAEFWSCVARANDGDYADNRDGSVLDSLGMIEGAWNRTDWAGYWFHVECEMAGEALAQLDALIQTPGYDSEETLS